MKKKLLLIIFLAAFLVLIGGLALAVQLEVQYPRLTTGEIITPTTDFTGYVKYLFNLGILLGMVLAVFVFVLGGFLYAASAGRPEIITRAKDQIWGGVSGLVLLLTIYLIVATVNPVLTILSLTPLDEQAGLYILGPNTKRPVGLTGISDVNRIKPPKSSVNFTQIEYKCAGSGGPLIIVYFYNQPNKVGLYKQTNLGCGQPPINIEGRSFDFRYRTAGIYLYTQNNCQVSEPPPSYHTTSIPNFGDLKNRVNSVGIAHLDPNYYIAILYELINHEGACYQINPNLNPPCDDLNRGNFKRLAASASIYKYSFGGTPGGKITFYRKPDWDPTGGSFEITNREIVEKGGVYGLLYTEFADEDGNCTVPVEERDCVKWDPEIAGKCLERKCPLLAGGGCAEWDNYNCKKPLDSSGPNISSMKIEGDYLVVFVYFDPNNDVPVGKWTYCQGFPTTDDANRQGPRQIKWEYIQRAGNIPNFVVIWPVKKPQ